MRFPAIEFARAQHIIDARAVLLMPDLNELLPDQFGKVVFHAAHAARQLGGKRGLRRPAMVSL